MTYREKLKNPKWQRKRLEIFQRDKFRCQHCRSKEATLHVHHIYYTPNTDPWDYPDEALVTLCEFCHEAETKTRNKEEKELLEALRFKHFSPLDLNQLTDAISMAKLECTPNEFVEFMDWFLLDNQENVLKLYYETGISSRREDEETD